MALLARPHLLLLRRCTAAAARTQSPARLPSLLPLLPRQSSPRQRRAVMSSSAAAAGASGDGSKAAAAAPQEAVDALALFTGPGSDHLRGQSCSVHGCSAETPPVPKEELPRLLAALPAWRLSPDGSSLSRAFVTRNFLAALAFFQRVGDLAEREAHHPDLHLTDYRRVEVVVATHAGGARVTMADLVLAAKIDALPAEYSPKWLKERQQEQQAAKAE